MPERRSKQCLDSDSDSNRGQKNFKPCRSCRAYVTCPLKQLKHILLILFGVWAGRGVWSGHRCFLLQHRRLSIRLMKLMVESETLLQSTRQVPQGSVLILSQGSELPKDVGTGAWQNQSHPTLLAQEARNTRLVLWVLKTF